MGIGLGGGQGYVFRRRRLGEDRAKVRVLRKGVAGIREIPQRHGERCAAAGFDVWQGSELWLYPEAEVPSVEVEVALFPFDFAALEVDGFAAAEAFFRP